MYSLRSPNFSTSMWYVFTNFPLKTLARRKYLSFVISFIVLFFTIPGFASDDHLLISEAVVTPTANEFIEIANPTGSAIDLTDYYLSDDEDYALLPGAFGGGRLLASQASTSSLSFLREPRSRPEACSWSLLMELAF